MLLEAIPGTKFLKPVANVLGDATKYFFKYGDDLLGLIKTSGVVKFTQEAIEKLANRAIKYNSGIPEPKKVMLGKNWKDGISYVTEAKNRNCIYFELDDWDNFEKLVNYNEKEMFEINKKFLENMYDKGKEFFFSHNPYEADGFLLDEVNYLKGKGFTFEKVVGETNLWKAIK